MLELLSPVGSPEAVTAAVQSGTDSVYFGFDHFNARRNAKNFSQEAAQAAVTYCHTRGVKVYLTLNTLVTDRELPAAAQAAQQANAMGMDAVIVQDLGVARMLRQVAPDLPLHGSTQMSIHNLDGVKQCADLGMERVVVARELSRSQLELICTHSPIGIEAFVHGALCMCYSGQCFFSSVIGGRSGNRGLCAQPCRLEYGWGNKADSYPLSLKDLSLAGYLKELRKMGISCLKIEGRMKRPEYVAIVTGIYARALKEGREPTQPELSQLEDAFSRQGFTQGYFLGEPDAAMFGVRQEERPPQALYAQARTFYETGEQRKEPVTFYVRIVRAQPAQVAVRDNLDRVATVEGPVPEAAQSVPLTGEKAEQQLSRTGGTPYACQKVISHVEPGLSLPLSALNALRRDALNELTRQRAESPKRRNGIFHPGARYENPKTPPVITLSVRSAEQVTAPLLQCRPALLYLPVSILAEKPDLLKRCADAGTEVAALLPRICTHAELDTLRCNLSQIQAQGVAQALAGDLGLARTAGEMGFVLRGDYGLNVFNSQTLKELKRLGFRSATASFELKLAQIRDLNKALDVELLAYGRLPLMITEHCVIKNRSGICTCQNPNLLIDRKGERFPVLPAPGCRNEIFNSKKLFLADKEKDYVRLGLWAVRLMFTSEDPQQCVRILRRYQNADRYAPDHYTRGLYYRGVE